MGEYYDQEAVWEAELDKLNLERIETIVRTIPAKVRSVLELGCGDGRIVNRIRGKGLIVGMDASVVPLSKVRVEALAGLAEHIPFQDAAFDIVIASELLEHLTDEQLIKTCREMKRIAKKYVLVSVPYKEKPYMTHIKCQNCGHTFSPYGHKQYFDDQRLTSLYPQADSKIQYIGTKVHAPLYEKVGQKFLNSYHDFKKPAVCPNCKTKAANFKIEGNRIHDIYRGFAYDKMKNLFRVLPNWILCLYEFRE